MDGWGSQMSDDWLGRPIRSMCLLRFALGSNAAPPLQYSIWTMRGPPCRTAKLLWPCRRPVLKRLLIEATDITHIETKAIQYIMCLCMY